MDTELLTLLRCPQTGGAVRPATPAELTRINTAIANGGTQNHSGEFVHEILDDCLICDLAGLCYPVRDGLPVMLAGEAFDIPH